MAQAQGYFGKDINPRYLLILAAPISVYLFLEFVLKNFGDGTLQLPVDGFADPAQMIELTGRYKFLSAFAFFGSVSIAVLAIFALDIATNYTRKTVLWSIVAILLSAAFGLVLSVFEPEAFDQFETYYLLGREFFEAALGSGKVGVCPVETADCGDKTAMYLFRTLSNPINALTSFGAAAALTGVILSLSKTRDAGRDAVEDIGAQAADLRAAQVIAQRYLYCAGLLLTAGMMFVMAWMHWPAALIADSALRAAYNDLTGAITLYIGVGYSLMILSCYLPVMLIHTKRAERLRAQIDGAGPAAASTSDPKFALPELSYVKSLNSIVAILSPVLASAIGSFGQGILFS